MYILTVTREGFEHIEQKTGFDMSVKVFSSKKDLFDEIERQVLEKHCSVAAYKDKYMREKLTTSGVFRASQGWLRIFKLDGSVKYTITAWQAITPGWTEQVKFNDRLTVVCWESGLLNYDVECEKIRKEEPTKELINDLEIK